MNKEEFLNYIIDFATDTDEDDLKRIEELKDLFTAWCFIFGADADTKEYLEQHLKQLKSLKTI